MAADARGQVSKLDAVLQLQKVKRMSPKTLIRLSRLVLVIASTVVLAVVLVTADQVYVTRALPMALLPFVVAAMTIAKATRARDGIIGFLSCCGISVGALCVYANAFIAHRSSINTVLFIEVPFFQLIAVLLTWFVLRRSAG